jgi:DNA-binding transcriptional MerR regulator
MTMPIYNIIQEVFMTIKEASKALDIKEHVLRYWEEELNLTISRNDMGYRDYNKRDIDMFKQIIRLRNQGVGLKDIRDAITKYQNTYTQTQSSTDISDEASANDTTASLPSGMSDESSANKADVPDEIKIVDFKTAQLQSVMNKIVANAFRENKELITASLRDEFTENIVEFFNQNKKYITSTLRGQLTEDVMKQIDIILSEQEARDEARFKKLDATIRELQSARSEAAATQTKKRLFKR